MLTSKSILLAKWGGGISLKLDPQYSGGYTTWSPVSNATSYTINLYSNDGYDHLALLSSTTTSNNYHKFDPLFFQIPGATYKITAGNSAGTIIASSDDIICLNLGFLGYETLCGVTCNGTSYAYKIEIGDNAYIDPQNGQVTTSDLSLGVHSTYKYYDANTAIAMPYWQAMPYVTYTNLPTGHPYKIQSTFSGNFDYRREHLSSQLAPGVYFYDKNNNSITDGWLIEKKMDQFDHFLGKTTPSTAIISESDCGNTLNGVGSSWIGMANSLVTGVTYPTVSNPFTNTIVHDLECIESYESFNGGQIDTGDVNSWYWWLMDIKDLVHDLEQDLSNNNNGHTWEEIEESVVNFGNLNSGNGYVTGVALKAISNNQNSTYEFSRQSNQTPLRLSKGNGNLLPGLYKITIYTSDAEVLPFYLSIAQELPIPEQADFIELIVAPNPITDNVLRYSISNEIALAYQILIHDLNGTIISSHSETPIEGENLNFELILDSGLTPYNQMIVTLVCQDGSVVQKNALKL